jgi:hypothetical protein
MAVVGAHRYPRCWDREKVFFEPVHYLALLERKPGGFDHAKALGAMEPPGVLRIAPQANGGR